MHTGYKGAGGLVSHLLYHICQIGLFMKHFYKEIHRLDGKVYLNSDDVAVIIGTSDFSKIVA